MGHMQDRPTASELLDIIAETLREQVMPATHPGARHAVRVAANLCRILERELALGSDADARERERLAGLLGVSSDGRGAAELSSELIDRIERGDTDLEQRAWPVAVANVREKLAIAKPDYDAHDARAEASA